MADAGTDRLKASSDAQLAASAVDVLRLVPEIRQDRVDAARKALAAGEIGNDPLRLADRLIDSWLGRQRGSDDRSGQRRPTRVRRRLPLCAVKGDARRDGHESARGAAGLPPTSAAGRAAEAPWRIETALGAFEIDEADIVHFGEGLPGFEENRRFVLLSSEAAAPLHALHAVDGPPASFVVVDPRLVVADYRTALGQADRARLGAADEGSLVWLALVTVDGQQGTTVNLRAPIVINPARMIGFQVLPHNSLYPLRHPLGAE